MKYSELHNSIFKSFSVMNLKEGTFSDLSKFDYSGVYIIVDNSDEIIYIGSSYSRLIKTRLKQYERLNDSGNTLLRAICMKEFNLKDIKSVKEIDAKFKEEALKKIKEYKIIALQYNDLEYNLISKCKPKFNKAGNQ